MMTNKTLHSTFCCTQHGCKYSEPQCTVVLGIEQGNHCALCDAEQEQKQVQLDQLLNDAMTQGPVLESVAEAFQKQFEVYLCACNSEGLHAALKMALAEAISTYVTRCSK
jgi:hypothetical protein